MVHVFSNYVTWRGCPIGRALAEGSREFESQSSYANDLPNLYFLLPISVISASALFSQ